MILWKNAPREAKGILILCEVFCPFSSRFARIANDWRGFPLQNLQELQFLQSVIVRLFQGLSIARCFDGYPDCFPVRQGVSRGSSPPNTPVSVLFNSLFGMDDRSLCFDLPAYLVLHRQDSYYDYADAPDSKNAGVVVEDCFHDSEVFLLVLNFRFPELTHHDWEYSSEGYTY